MTEEKETTIQDFPVGTLLHVKLYNKMLAKGLIHELEHKNAIAFYIK